MNFIGPWLLPLFGCRKSEIDEWFRAPRRLIRENGRHSALENGNRLLRTTEPLVTRTSRLADCFEAVQKEIDRAMRITVALQTSCQTNRTRRTDSESSRMMRRANLSSLRHQTARARTLVTALHESLIREGALHSGFRNKLRHDSFWERFWIARERRDRA